MKIISIFLVVGILGSCMWTENPFDYCGKERPLNDEEKKLYRELKNKFNGSVSIFRVDYQYQPKYYGLDCEGFGKEYSISMYDWSDKQILDTTFRRETAKDLALNIYNSILEDSLKNYIEEFEFSFGNFDSPDSLKINVDISIKKTDIEKFLGEKLIVKSKQFHRVKIKKEKDIKLTEKVKDYKR